MRVASGLRAEDFGLSSSYMPRQYSPLWKTTLPDWREKLESSLAKMNPSGMPPLFFRADGIGAAGQAFETLCRIFRHHQAPLAMAVVPAWLSDARQERLFASAPPDEQLWGWHQNGWRYVNWQKDSIKAEFGEDRPYDRQHDDILRGRQKMEAIFGTHFIPVFTPPWDRFNATTIKALRNLAYKGISTTAPLPQGVKIPWGLYNLTVGLDMHVRALKDPATDFENLLSQLTDLCKAEECTGIAVNPQRMTPFAFEFLDHLLYNLKNVLDARFFSFREILTSTDEKKAGARLR